MRGAWELEERTPGFAGEAGRRGSGGWEERACQPGTRDTGREEEQSEWLGVGRARDPAAAGLAR